MPGAVDDVDSGVEARGKADAVEQARGYVIQGDARSLATLVTQPVHLIVTSPPYPMIAMWDDCFTKMDPSILKPEEWKVDTVQTVFEKMHAQLDVVWQQMSQVVVPGGIVAINVGDAARRVDECFQSFPNAARITIGMLAAGFVALPNIYWKKPTNKPNAFLGSGFLPVNAYVTMDCEHILLFRKGTVRRFSRDEKLARKHSTFSKAERDVWFSQTWTDIPGAPQHTVGDRRTGAYPIAIPERLIRMFSIQGDTVLDPFVGTGTTCEAAQRLKRNPIGVEIHPAFCDAAMSKHGRGATA